MRPRSSSVNAMGVATGTSQSYAPACCAPDDYGPSEIGLGEAVLQLGGEQVHLLDAELVGFLGQVEGELDEIVPCQPPGDARQHVAAQPAGIAHLGSTEIGGGEVGQPRFEALVPAGYRQCGRRLAR